MTDFKDTVNEIVNKLEKGEDGKWKLPEDLDEPTKFAVITERRYRDTQGAFTKSQQELKRQEAIANSLQERLLKSETPLTKEQKFELNNLKKTDPEAWRAKLNEYEQANKTKLETELDTIRTQSANKGEIEVRKEQMAAWSQSTGIELTDEVVANDLPPRFMKELESGKVTFEQFLEKAGNFLKAEKVIKGASASTDDNEPNLGTVAGGSEPSKTAQEGDFVETYEKGAIF